MNDAMQWVAIVLLFLAWNGQGKRIDRLVGNLRKRLGFDD